jgi:hypothetical protein
MRVGDSFRKKHLSGHGVGHGSRGAITTVPLVCWAVDSEQARSRLCVGTDGTDGRRDFDHRAVAWPGGAVISTLPAWFLVQAAASAPPIVRRARYLFPVETIAPGELVQVAGRGPDLDGIVFDVPSHSKVVVAVVEPGRGPTFRTVHPAALTARGEEGPDDRALRLLLGRTPSPVHDAARGGSRGGRGRPGHTRVPTHRTTGR